MATYPDDASASTVDNRWTMSDPTYVQSFSVVSQEPVANGLYIKPDGSKMYIIGSNTNSVHEYDLSSAWDISTASYIQSFSVASQETNTQELFFKSDGSKMYVIGVANDNVSEYDLSSAWDISSATHNQNFSVSAREGLPTALFFKPDGSKMYVAGISQDIVIEYDLSSAWDVSTATYVQEFSIQSQEEGTRGISFKSDGSKMYVVGVINNIIYEYDLSSAWDISTATYRQGYSVADQETATTGLTFKTDGSTLFVIGPASDSVHQYDLGAAPTSITMTAKKPDRGYSYDREYNIINFESEAGYERRSLRSRRPKRKYSLEYTNVSGLVRQAIENFYIARSGALESFLLDLEHVGDSGSIYVRFDGPISITEVRSGLGATRDVYNISFDLIETYT